MSFFKKSKVPLLVTFATSCWEKDWNFILKDPFYLKIKQIENHNFEFKEKMLIINNVKDVEEVSHHAKSKVKDNILTNYYIAKDFEEEVLEFFKLKKEDFRASKGYKDEWVFYNAIGVLTAIYLCKTPYFLYHTGDSFLEDKIDWIPKAIELMEKKKKYKVANLSWNHKYKEAEKESYKKKGDFFVAKQGFSDQLFLVKTKDFKRPIYSEIRDDSHHFPRGDVFEKRVFSFMKNRRWKRITYRHGSYIHNSF